ncbi:hypothetical protein BDM02DRAFT_3117446 [Thelephora ganbajun]|uniref:Uncharacterized protein n=1 Tax=Thelephora ganbajun TaxID=370292 RepID=A0ACB6ZBR2_THEGA|nr:hypothetical protein BDM02DRAFT_3117446 [Thelephora ganbajun]
MVFSRAFAVTVVFLTALVNAATYTGKVQVINGEGSSNGFLKNWNSGFDGVDYGGNPLLVSITTNSTGPLNLVAINAVFPPPYYLGAQSSSYHPNLAPGSDVIVALTNVNPTSPGAPPDASYSESAIWYFDTVTKKLTPQWINTDGSRPATYIAYDIKYNKIFLSGDVNAYNAVFNWKPASPVSFYLVSN